MTVTISCSRGAGRTNKACLLASDRDFSKTSEALPPFLASSATRPAGGLKVACSSPVSPNFASSRAHQSLGHILDRLRQSRFDGPGGCAGMNMFPRCWRVRAVRASTGKIAISIRRRSSACFPRAASANVFWHVYVSVDASGPTTLRRRPVGSECCDRIYSKPNPIRIAFLSTEHCVRDSGVDHTLLIFRPTPITRLRGCRAMTCPTNGYGQPLAVSARGPS